MGDETIESWAAHPMGQIGTNMKQTLKEQNASSTKQIQVVHNIKFRQTGWFSNLMSMICEANIHDVDQK